MVEVRRGACSVDLARAHQTSACEIAGADPFMRPAEQKCLTQLHRGMLEASRTRRQVLFAI